MRRQATTLLISSLLYLWKGRGNVISPDVMNLGLEGCDG